jgi:short-subunit dehydrogenase involved in D-alanine esterification of teichoic acids
MLFKNKRNSCGPHRCLATGGAGIESGRELPRRFVQRGDEVMACGKKRAMQADVNTHFSPSTL